MGFSNTPDPLTPQFPADPTESGLAGALTSEPRSVANPLPGHARRPPEDAARKSVASHDQHPQTEQLTCKCGQSSAPSHEFCTNCGAALWQRCLDCGAPCGTEDFFCGSCGMNRERAAKDYTKNFEAKLFQARKLKDAYQYDEALAVLRALAETELRKEDAEKVERRIKRVHEWREHHTEKARSRIRRARNLVDEFAYEDASRLLQKVSEAFRDEEVERLAQLAKANAKDTGKLYDDIKQAFKEKRFAKALPAINRFLSIAPNHPKARRIAGLRRDYYLGQARDQFRKHNYARTIEILDRIPIDDRNNGVEELREKSERCARVLDEPRTPLADVPSLTGDKPEKPVHPERVSVIDQAEAHDPATEKVDEQAGWLQELRRFNRKCLRNGWTPWLLAVYGHVLLLIFLYCLSLSADELMDEGMRSIYLTAAFVEPVENDTIAIEPPSAAEQPIEEPAEEILEAAPDAVEDITPEDPPPNVVETEEVEPIEPIEEESESAAAPIQEPSSVESEALPEEAEPVEEPIEPAPEPPVAAHAVRSGNFIVWSEPPVPIPGEPYSVYVRIRLPDRIKRYPRRDLSGVLVGSDGYRKVIGTTQKGYLPLVDNTATIVIPVVGATRPEADTLVIRSRLLKQQKMIKLIYDRDLSQDLSRMR